MRKRFIHSLLVAVLGAVIVALDYLLPHPKAYLADPISIAISIAISAALTAGTVGLEYLAAKKAKVAPVDRGKQDDIRVSVPGYGEQIVKSWGTVRGAPVWFWHIPPVDRPVVTPGHSGGKGPPKPPTPTTTDHQYFSSIAGVFHDGEIQGVNRIWFNADLVWNTAADSLSVTRYEAESATLGGTAAITSAAYASNGAGVTHVGTGGGDNGYVDFAVTIADDGDYDIAIGYQSDSITYNLQIRVDGSLVGTVSCAPSGPSLIAIQTIGLTLTAGAHTIRLGNTTGNSAPNLDYIDILETVSFADGSLADRRVTTELIDPAVTPPTDETKAWPAYNARPLEMAEDGTPLVGTHTLTATLSKWGNPEIRIYRGTLDQPADPAIIADKGVDNTPAWRGLAYIVIDNLLMPNGALPNVTIEWNQGTTDVDTIVEEHYALGEVDSSDLDVTALAGLTIPGVIRTSQKAIGDSLKDLQTRFQFDMIEVDGIVKALLRNRDTADLTISYTKLRAHAEGSDTPAQDAVIKDIDPRLLPYSVEVNGLDIGNDFHNGIQADMRASGPQTEVVSVSLALAMNKHEMKQLASVLLYKPDMEGREFSFETGPEFIKAIPGTIIDLQLLNATHRIRVGDAKYGLPAGVCQFQAVRQAASLYSPTGFGSLSGREDPIAGFPSNTKGVILEGPLFRPEDAGDGTQPVAYIGMCGIGGGAWPGGALHQESPVGSGNYILLTLASVPTAIGVADATTLGATIDPTIFDRTSTLTIDFYYDPQLSTVTENELLNNPNLNLIAVQNPSTEDVECLQFSTATPGVAPSPFVARYVISVMLRGRFLTEQNIASHTAADRVAFIDSTLKPRRFDLMEVGR